MAQIIPFKAVRPARDKAHLVASRSYVSYAPRQLSRKLEENPFSFIHIINPEFGSPKRSRPNSIKRFQKIKEKFGAFCNEEILHQDEHPGFYIYRQVSPTNSFTGLVCGVHVKEYLEGNIKIHEHTITSRVEVFTKYLDVCDFNAEPVLLTFTDKDKAIKKLLAEKMLSPPTYDFTTTDRNRHQLWPIFEQREIAAIQSEFGALEHLYIADGHHRMASSAHLGEIRRERAGWKPTDICNYALALVLPEDELNIQPFHRILRMDYPIDEALIIQKIGEAFTIKKSSSRYLPKQKQHFGMRLSSGWYRLSLKEEIVSKSVVEHLDPMILTQKILEPIFKINDQKTDRRINFIPGIKPLDPYEKSIDDGVDTVLFTLFHITAKELFAVSDAKEVMPPKSTYVEPKLRSGLTIMKLS